MEQRIDAREGTGGRERMMGAAYPLEIARRAIAAQARSEPEPLDDPWFIDEGPVRAAGDDRPRRSQVG
jgi:hypothetical protein